ncbi:MAG TPA: hypothetical protein VEA41_07285 [Salinarimonas sp.]|nr:hypothetical protein [Salinarimonas sp.]
MSTNRFTTDDPGHDKVIGRFSTSKVGFFGATPIVRPSGAAQAAISTSAVTSSSPVGFVTATQASALLQQVAEMRTVLVNLGLMAGA